MRWRSQSLLIRAQVLSVLGATLLVIAASASPSTTASTSTGEVPAITLVEQRALRIKNSDLIALSPDGALIAASRPAGRLASSSRSQPSKLCIHDVATLTERACADVSDLPAGLWIDSVVWSPDSKWLAFAERWGQYLVDGDLWLMEASTGALTNLLDDGYDGVLDATPAGEVVPGRPITLPSYPAFTPDSTAVTFSRNLIEGGEWTGSDMATVPIEGGEAARLGDCMPLPPFGYLGKRWTADGSRLYVSLLEHQGSAGPAGGIQVLKGGVPERLLDVDDYPPSITAVSAGGEQLLVVDPRTRDLVAPAYALVDGTSGAVEPIVLDQSEDSGSAPITGAMLSPDGTRLLIISGRERKQVAIRDVASKHETVVLTEPAGSGPSGLAGEVLTWADNDTVLIRGPRLGRGTLLVLDGHSD